MRRRLLKTLTTLALSVLMIVSVISAFVLGIGADKPINAIADEGDTYQLVTDVSALNAGNEIVIVYTKGNMAMGAQNGTYRDKVSVTITNGTFKYVENVCVLTLGGSSGAWTLHASDGYLYYSGSKNSLNTSEDKSGYTWEIKINPDNTATITSASASHSGRAIQYNTGSPRFACYTTTQDAVSIYKLVENASGPETCEHNWQETSHVDATCTEDGSVDYECSVCGNTKTETLKATGHNYVDGECTVCHEKQATTLTINRDSFGSASGYAWHGWTATATTGETVSGKGYIYGTKLSSIQMNSGKTANYIYNSDSLPGSIVSVKVTTASDSHTVDVMTSATAYVSKSEKLTLGDTKQTVSASGATWEFTTTDKYFAIAITDGAAYLSSIEITYKICSHANTEAIGEAKKATCTEDGTTAGLKCSVCGEILEEQTTIPATGHKDEDGNGICDICSESLCTEHAWVKVEEESIPATCTENGSEKYECTACHQTKTETLTAPGHTEVIDEAVAATCTKTGLTEGKHCSVCNEVLVTQTIIPATGHDYDVDDICTKCGAEKPSYIKVTTELTDWSGEYLIVYENGNESVAFNGALTKLDAASNTQSVTISDGKITGDFANYTFIIEQVDGGYSIKNKSGYYIGQTTDANGLSSSKTTEYKNTILFGEDGTLNIISSGGAYLRYNAASNQLRFRYYKSDTYTGQEAITLYKLVSKPVVKGVQLALNKGVTVKVTYDVPELWLNVNKDAKVVFSNGKEVQSFAATSGENVYSVDLTPAQINDTLTVKIQLADGTVFGAETDVSVSAYKTKVEAAGYEKLGLTEDKYNALKALLKAALTYSNAADGAIEENLSNDFEGVGDATIVHGKKDENGNTADKDKLFTGYQGTLSKYASVTVGVNTDNIQDGDKLVIQVGTGENVKEFDFANGLNAEGNIVIDGIYPLNFDDTISIKATKEGSMAEFTFNEYLKAVFLSTEDTNVKNLAVATYLYGLAAEAFFALS